MLDVWENLKNGFTGGKGEREREKWDMRMMEDTKDKNSKIVCIQMYIRSS